MSFIVNILLFFISCISLFIVLVESFECSVITHGSSPEMNIIV